MPSADSRLNLLLVIADDQQAGAIAALGHPTVQTPALDALVRAGTAFTRARIMGSLMPAVCAPTRASLFTGRGIFRADADPGLVRGPEYLVRMPADAPTLPECFRAAGYETFLSGKWHNDIPALLRSFEQARNVFHGGMSEHTAVPVRDLAELRQGAPARIAAGFSTDVFCDTVAEFIRGRRRERPFFACLSFTSPHDPRTPPAEFRQLYDPASIPLPGNFQPEHPFDNGELAVRDEQLAEKPLTPAVLREHLADYYGMISHQDAALGRVLQALRAAGEWENTLVVYVADHGLALGQHGLLGKQNLYEHSVRVPLILHGPGVPRGERRDTLAYSFDLFATVCELAGVSAPAELDSRSLVPALRTNEPGRDEICAVYMDRQRMITDGRWKLIVYHVDRRPRRQLFDLARDPEERNDLAPDPQFASLMTELASRLASWQDEVGDRWWPAPRKAAVTR